MRLRSLTGVAAAIVASASLFAGQEGALRVTVLKPDRKPLVGATIRATVAVSSPSQINSAIIAKTDDKGVATFWKLTPGVFTIQVEVEGYDAGAIRTDVQADKISHLQVLLRPLPAIEIGIEDTFDALDPTSATTGMNVKPDMIRSIPTGVSGRIADLALLVPGVNSDPVLWTSGNQRASMSDPSLLVAINRDKSGKAMFSTNNYLLDGIDVSEPLYGRGTVNIMQELLADVDVKTGGVSAEYQAKNGIFINATTISGSNEWHGGLSVSYAPSSFQANPKSGRNSIAASFQSTGFFVEGPLVKSKLWMVAAVQGVLDRGTLSVPDSAAVFPGETRSFTSNDEKNLFGKLTWQINPANRLITEYHSNRRTADTADSPQNTTNWTNRMELGGDRYLFWYSIQQPWLIFDLKFGHDHQVQNIAPKQAGDFQIQVNSIDPITAGQAQLGSASYVITDHTNRSDLRGDLTLPFTTGLLRHTLKLGYQSAKAQYYDDVRIRGSIHQDINTPMTFGDIVFNNLTYLPYYIDPLLFQINTNPLYSGIKTALSGPSGEVGFDEIVGYTFDEPNPLSPGTYLVGRQQTRLASNPSTVKSVMDGYYIQDYITLGRVTFSPGFRVDSYKIINDIDQTVFNQKSLFAPRVSLTWDVFGDASAKAYAYYGRYFNPPFGVVQQSLGLTKTTGLLSQARIMGQWVDVWDSVPNDPGYADIFGDSTMMPYTDEFRVGYEHVIRVANVVHSFAVAGTYRKDRRIIQNVDYVTYTDPEALESAARFYFGITNPAGSTTPSETRVINAMRALAMPASAFAGGGRSGEENVSGFVNIFINAPGAERNFKAFDASYRFESNRGMFSASFSRLKAEGNSMETGDLSLSTFFPHMDPRLPWMQGTLDGSIDWLFKFYGSYKFSNDFLVGVFGRYDSGYHYTPSTSSGSSLAYLIPDNVDLLDGFRPGQKMTPKRVIFDLHLEKRFQITKRANLSIGVDVYNLFNNQNGTALAEGTNVRPGVAADQPYLYNPPRTVSMAAKIRF